ITASLSRQSKGDGGSGGGKLADNNTLCTICAARSLRNFRCVKITDIVTQPRKRNSYRRFIGRSAGNSGGVGQGMQTEHCMRNLQTQLWTRLSAMWLISGVGT